MVADIITIQPPEARHSQDPMTAELALRLDQQHIMSKHESSPESRRFEGLQGQADLLYRNARELLMMFAVLDRKVKALEAGHEQAKEITTAEQFAQFLAKSREVFEEIGWIQTTLGDARALSGEIKGYIRPGVNEALRWAMGESTAKPRLAELTQIATTIDRRVVEANALTIFVFVSLLNLSEKLFGKKPKNITELYTLASQHLPVTVTISDWEQPDFIGKTEALIDIDNQRALRLADKLQALFELPSMKAIAVSGFVALLLGVGSSNFTKTDSNDSGLDTSGLGTIGVTSAESELMASLEQCLDDIVTTSQVLNEVVRGCGLDVQANQREAFEIIKSQLRDSGLDEARAQQQAIAILTAIGGEVRNWNFNLGPENHAFDLESFFQSNLDVEQEAQVEGSSDVLRVDNAFIMTEGDSPVFYTVLNNYLSRNSDLPVTIRMGVAVNPDRHDLGNDRMVQLFVQNGNGDGGLIALDFADLQIAGGTTLDVQLRNFTNILLDTELNSGQDTGIQYFDIHAERSNEGIRTSLGLRVGSTLSWFEEFNPDSLIVFETNGELHYGNTRGIENQGWFETVTVDENVQAVLSQPLYNIEGETLNLNLGETVVMQIAQYPSESGPRRVPTGILLNNSFHEFGIVPQVLPRGTEPVNIRRSGDRNAEIIGILYPSGTTDIDPQAIPTPVPTSSLSLEANTPPEGWIRLTGLGPEFPNGGYVSLQVAEVTGLPAQGLAGSAPMFATMADVQGFFQLPEEQEDIVEQQQAIPTPILVPTDMPRNSEGQPLVVADAEMVAAAEQVWQNEFLARSQEIASDGRVSFRIDQSLVTGDPNRDVGLMRIVDEPRFALFRESTLRSNLLNDPENPASRALAGNSFEEFLQNWVAAQERGETPTAPFRVINMATGRSEMVRIPLGQISNIQGSYADGSLTFDIVGGVQFVVDTGLQGGENSIMRRGGFIPTIADGSTGDETYTDFYYNPASPNEIRMVAAADPDLLYNEDGTLNTEYLANVMTEGFFTMSRFPVIAQGHERSGVNVAEFNGAGLRTGDQEDAYWRWYLGVEGSDHANVITTGVVAFATEAQVTAATS
jgi:hypothetical protein